MKKKTRSILTSLLYFAAAACFLLYAWNLQSLWIILAMAFLCLAIFMRYIAR